MTGNFIAMRNRLSFQVDCQLFDNMRLKTPVTTPIISVASEFLLKIKKRIKIRETHDVSVVTVLSWLKEQPPLTDEQLRNLYISMEDFKVLHVSF